MIAATVQTKSIEELVASLTARGCEIDVNRYGLIKVTGECDAQEMMALQRESERVAEIIHEPKSSEYDIEEDIACWMRACTEARGYDWSINNWLTEKYRAELDSDIEGWRKSEVSVREVHESFVRWADAHKRQVLVTDDSRRRQTVTPQIQPQVEDFAR